MDERAIPECEWCGESVFSPCNKDDSADCVLAACIRARQTNEQPPTRIFPDFMNKPEANTKFAQKSSQEFKADGGKSNPALLEAGMPRALEVVNDTLDYGAIKYEAHSWLKVPEGMSRYDSAARRHRRARDKGETHDSESNVLHLAHEIVCNLFQLELMLRADPKLRVAFNASPPQGHKA